MDAISGYNQIYVTKKDRHKLTFSGQNCSKYAMNATQCGPINVPTVFIVLVFVVDSTWKSLARKNSIIIDDGTNTKTIFDGTFSWTKISD